MNKLVLLGLVFALVIAGCAQQAQVKNETPLKNETPVKNDTPAPPPTNQTPPVPPQNETEIDEDMFSEDLEEALDDLDAVTDPSDLEQTSENTFCDSDNDCWCRIFDGAKFLPGKTEWYCDKEKNRCNACIYK
ncbi:MAG: hypothetical protein MN733_07165 [Nitrososphaera sp.]|nr:hypothetical protein [Nitrososphaera sp.]